MKNYRPLFACLLIIISSDISAQYKMEYLTRGIHAVSDGSGKVFVSWRLLGTEDTTLAFNLYRTTNNKTIKLNKSPIIAATNFTDVSADTNKSNIYTVKVIVNKKEEKTGSSFTLPVRAKPYLSIQLNTPAGYIPNDASVGDVDGDGVYEIILHQAGRARDNSQNGITDPPIFQCYKMNGTLLC